MPTDQEVLELKHELDERLELVNSDPEYEGANPTAGDQWMLALVGLVIPALLMLIGWVLYA
jgi:tetrahydromethanopterin S-methyltransferase subunit B